MRKRGRRIYAAFCAALLLGTVSAGCAIPQKNDEETKNMQKTVQLQGFAGQRFKANKEQWLLTVPYANPAMLEMFRQRENQPQQPIVAWYGEFPGKYLTSAVLAYAMDGSDELREVIEDTVTQLCMVQAEDGYLGVFSKDNRLSGKIHPSWGDDTHWDLWGHYHCMLGLYLWYKQSGDTQAFAACTKAADYVYNFFVTQKRSIEDAGSHEMNMSICHIYALLYKETGDARYLEMVNYIFKAFETKGCGDYVNAALAGTEFYKMEKPRWEGLHCVQAIYEMYRITDDERYRTAVENIWWSILKTDRHNTGGFSSGEQAQGNPYDLRAIETCCTVAWMALSVDMLNLTDNSYIADELELSTINGIFGAQHPFGRYFVYNAPMIGDKKASAHEIAFQARPASPELNCCSVNGPRGIGMIYDWGVTAKEKVVTVNYYGASRTQLPLPGGQQLTIVQETDYPRSGAIKLKLITDKPVEAELRLRIPFWSAHTTITFNGTAMEPPQAKGYYTIAHTFKSGDQLELNLDMSLHRWNGDLELGGRAALYRGPVLLAYDQRFNDTNYQTPPVLSLDRLDYTLEEEKQFPQPMLLARFTDSDGRPVYLCDYATAGASGTGFTTWMPFKEQLPPAEFAPDAPVWGAR